MHNDEQATAALERVLKSLDELVRFSKKRSLDIVSLENKLIQIRTSQKLSEARNTIRETYFDLTA